MLLTPIESRQGHHVSCAVLSPSCSQPANQALRRLSLAFASDERGRIEDPQIAREAPPVNPATVLATMLAKGRMSSRQC
jgi:hypothetical protein